MNHDEQKVIATIEWFANVGCNAIPIFNELNGLGRGIVYVYTAAVGFYINEDIPVSEQHPLVRARVDRTREFNDATYPQFDYVEFDCVADAAIAMAVGTDYPSEHFLSLIQDIQAILREGQETLGLPLPDYQFCLDWVGFSCFGKVGFRGLNVANLIEMREEHWAVLTQLNLDFVPLALLDRVKQVTAALSGLLRMNPRPPVLPPSEMTPQAVHLLSRQLQEVELALRAPDIYVSLGSAYAALYDIEQEMHEAIRNRAVLDEIAARTKRAARMSLLAQRAAIQDRLLALEQLADCAE